MLRRFALLVIVLVIGVVGGALGQSRLSASQRVASPHRDTGTTNTMPTPIAPPPTLAGLAASEVAFSATPAQEVVLGKATNDANENLLWSRLLDGVGAYTRSPAGTHASASRLEIALNRILPTGSVGYRVQDWRTDLGPLRFVEVSNGNKPSQPGTGGMLRACGAIGAPLFAALLLVWPSPSGETMAQPMWNDRSGSVGVSLLTPVLALGTSDLQSVRAWRGEDRQWRLVAIARHSCAATNSWDAAAGAVLDSDGTSWHADGTILSSELSVSHRFDAGLNLDGTEVRFGDPGGATLRLYSQIWNPGECHACEHASVTRRYVREGDRYLAEPWLIDSSPYTTLQEVRAIGIEAQKDPALCGDWDFPVALVRQGLTGALCALPWAKLAYTPENINNGGQAEYKLIPTIYTSASDSGTAQFTLTPHNGKWTLTAVSWPIHS